MTMANLYKVYYRHAKDADCVPGNNIDIIAFGEASARDQFKAIYSDRLVLITGVSLIQRDVA